MFHFEQLNKKCQNRNSKCDAAIGVGKAEARQYYSFFFFCRSIHHTNLSQQLENSSDNTSYEYKTINAQLNTTRCSFKLRAGRKVLQYQNWCKALAVECIAANSRFWSRFDQQTIKYLCKKPRTKKKKAKQAECTAFRFYYITFIWKHYTKYSHQQKFRPQEQYQLKRITVQLTAQKALRRVCENCPELPHSWYTKLLLMTKLPLTTLSPNKSALQVPHDITLKKYQLWLN